eukprot:3847946-Amphidinium_carterae.1
MGANEDCTKKSHSLYLQGGASFFSGFSVLALFERELFLSDCEGTAGVLVKGAGCGATPAQPLAVPSPNP